MGMATTFEVKIVGVTFQPNYPKTITSLTENDIVHIIPEPENPTDPNAIKVQNKNGTTIGYIPAAVAKKLCIEIKQGIEYQATIRPLINTEHDDKPGAVIKLTKNTKHQNQ